MVLLFLLALSMTSCSKDVGVVPENQQQKAAFENIQNEQRQQSTSSLEAASYTDIMDDLYGSGNYNITEAIKVSDEDSDYYVKVVSTDENERGYLVDIDREKDGNYENTIFVDHSIENQNKITYYNIAEGIEKNYDLTLDPNYPDVISFNPTETFGRPFIGTVTVITWLQDPNDGSWTKITTTDKYLCWIHLSHNESIEHFPPNAH